MEEEQEERENKEEEDEGTCRAFKAGHEGHPGVRFPDVLALMGRHSVLASGFPGKCAQRQRCACEKHIYLNCSGTMKMYQVCIRVGDNICRDIPGEHLPSQVLQLHSGVFHCAGEVLSHTHTHARARTHTRREKRRLQT